MDYLNQQPNFFAWRNHNGAIYDPKRKLYRKKTTFEIPGVSDILGVYRPTGQIIALEIKRPDSSEPKGSPEQQAFIRKINRSGGFGAVLDSLEKAKQFVEEIKNGKRPNTYIDP